MLTANKPGHLVPVTARTLAPARVCILSGLMKWQSVRADGLLPEDQVPTVLNKETGFRQKKEFQLGPS